MNHLVKIMVDEEGDPVDSPVWCLAVNEAGAPAAFCSGEVFGFGDVSSDEALHEEKYTARGGITCHDCLLRIREIKAVKL